MDYSSSNSEVEEIVEGSNQCPLVEWYRFKQCTIATCKNFSTKCKSNCMQLDRIEPKGTKVISDAELHLYKFPDEAVSTRLIALRRKKAVSQVKNILILKHFIAYLKEVQVKASKINLKYESDLIDRYKNKYPFKIKRLGFEDWMWPFITDEVVFSTYKTRAHAKRDPTNELSLVTLKDILSITEPRLIALRDSIRVRRDK